MPSASPTDAADVGARAAIVFSSGFAEIGDEGREFQGMGAEIAPRAGMRVLGPNCQGVIHVPRYGRGFSNSAGALVPRSRRPVA